MEAFSKLLALAELAQKAEVLDDFFSLMFTPQEYEQLQKRYALIEALITDELPQREISKALQVSIAKITRGSNALKLIDPKLKAILENFFDKSKE
jgi:TrpR family trp operon transcriptional repressor